MLIYSGPAMREYERLPDEEQRAIVGEYQALMEEPGVLGAEQLQPPESATTVRVDDGTVLTTGGVLAIIAFIIGFLVSRPASMRIARIGKAIAVAGGPPTPAQMDELKMLGKRLGTAGRVIAVLLIFAVIGMSIFRYAG